MVAQALKRLCAWFGDCKTYPENQGSYNVKPKAILAYCREKGIRAVDLRFPDVGGRWKHITFPVSALTENAFESGFGQELTLRGLPGETREQMVLIPLSHANYLDPLLEQPTLVILAAVQDALTREESGLDSRAVTLRSAEYLRATGIADEAVVRVCQPFALLHEQAQEQVSTGPASQRFLSCGPTDLDFGFRCTLSSSAAEAGVSIERHYRGDRSSSEVVLGAASLMTCCDDLMMMRYMIDQLADRHRLRLATAPLSTSTHWVLNRSGEGIFSAASHAGASQGLSDIGWHAIGGILHHASALAAIALAAPRFDIDAAYDWRRSVSTTEPDAVCNVIFGSHNPRSRAIEYRGSPAHANPYLHLAAVLMAMIDGIQNKIHASVLLSSHESGDPHHAEWIASPNGSSPDVDLLCESLADDRDFLLAGNVFNEELLELLNGYLRAQPEPT